MNMSVTEMEGNRPLVLLWDFVPGIVLFNPHNNP